MKSIPFAPEDVALLEESIKAKDAEIQRLRSVLGIIASPIDKTPGIATVTELYNRVSLAISAIKEDGGNK